MGRSPAGGGITAPATSRPAPRRAGGSRSAATGRAPTRAPPIRASAGVCPPRSTPSGRCLKALPQSEHGMNRILFMGGRSWLGWFVVPNCIRISRLIFRQPFLGRLPARAKFAEIHVWTIIAPPLIFAPSFPRKRNPQPQARGQFYRRPLVEPYQPDQQGGGREAEHDADYRQRQAALLPKGQVRLARVAQD